MIGKDRMDFTQQLKRELIASLPLKEDDREKRLAFLCAVTKQRGCVDAYKKSISLTYEFDSKQDAIDISVLVKEFCEGEVYFVFEGAKGDSLFKLQIKDKHANELLKRFCLSHFDGGSFVYQDGVESLRLAVKRKTFQWYLQGMLYSSAKLLFPDEAYSNYCLQISFTDTAYCEEVADTLGKLGISMQISKRKTCAVLQSRNGGDIADVLALGGANDSVLELNGIMTAREQENVFNRQSNFYMANYRKAVIGARKYLQAIDRLEESGALEKADAKLKRVAQARREYSDASMQELAQILSMSKTGLSRYLNKLLQMAGEDDDGRK